MRGSDNSPEVTGAQIGALIAIVQIRSGINRSRETVHALKLLRLERVHTASLIRSSLSLNGQMMKVKDVACWGPIEKGTLIQLLIKRGRLVGYSRLSESELKRYTGYLSVEALAEDLLLNKVELANVKGLKPFFRLMSPGLRASRKRAGSDRVLLGNLGKRINEVLMKML